jgi:hypothetical protein
MPDNLTSSNPPFAFAERLQVMSLVTQDGLVGDAASLKKVDDQYHDGDHQEYVD